MALTPNYYLKFSDPSKDPIIIAPKQTNNDMTLTLFGRNTNDWGVHLNENLVKLLENYCNDYPPGYDNQVAVGQFWYNSDTKELNLCTSSDPLIWKVIYNRRLDQPDNILLKSDIPQYLENYIPLSGNSIPTSGPIYVNDIDFNDSSANLNAVNKNYVDELVCVCGIYNINSDNYIKLSGDTINANVTVPSLYSDPQYAATPEFINNYTRTSVYTKKLSLTSITDYNYTEIDRIYDILGGDSTILGGYDGAIVYISGVVNLESGKHSTRISIPDIDDIYYAMTSGHNFDNAESTLINSDNADGTGIPITPCDTYHILDGGNSISLHRSIAINDAEIGFMLCGLAKGIKCRSCNTNKSFEYILSCDKAVNASKFPLNKTDVLLSTNQVINGVSWTPPTTAEDIPVNSIITVTVDGVDYVEGVSPELSVTGSTWSLTFTSNNQLPEGSYPVITSRSDVQGPLPNDCYSIVQVQDSKTIGINGLWYDIGVHNGKRYYVLNKKDGEKSLIWSPLNNITSAIGKYDGLYNSNTVLSQTKYPGKEYPAINFCKAVNIGGFNDWYLPASDELSYMIAHNDDIPQKDRLDETAIYWTSTEIDSGIASTLNLSNGSVYNAIKGTKNLVRAIRSVYEATAPGASTTNTAPPASIALSPAASVVPNSSVPPAASIIPASPGPSPSVSGLPTSIEESVSGGPGVTEKTYTIVKGGGNFSVNYDMLLKADSMIIYVNGDPVASTGTYVSGKGTLTVPGTSIPDNAKIKIKMEGGGDGTSWTYKINYSNGIKSNNPPPAQSKAPGASPIPASPTPSPSQVYIGGIKLADAPNASFVISDIGGSYYGTYMDCTTFIRTLNSSFYNSHDDWVIPSKSDLRVISDHRDDVDIAGTLSSYYKYWSNETLNGEEYDAMNLYDKKWETTSRFDKCMVRAIRYA